MLEAQNEYRRRRGARELTEDDANRMAREDEAIRERARQTSSAIWTSSRTSSAFMMSALPWRGR